MDPGFCRAHLGNQLRGRPSGLGWSSIASLRQSGHRLGAADLIISALQLFTGAQLLPRFVVFVSSAALVPVFVLVSGLSGATQRRRANLDRVIAIVAGEESDRLARDTQGSPNGRLS